MFKKLFLFTALLGTLATGCRKDPVAVYRTDSFSAGTFPKDTTQLFSLLISAYGNFRNANLFGFNLRSQDFSTADHTADLNYNGIPSWNDVARDNMNSTNGYAYNIWQQAYVGVQYANTFLAAADGFQTNYAKTPQDVSATNVMRGEAYFLRALCYYYLEGFYGEAWITNGAGGDKMGVPLIASTAAALDSTQVPRATVAQTWNFIINDLKTSIGFLHGVVQPSSMQGRVNEWAAKAMLSKVYVYTQDWTDAKTTLLDLFNNSGKSLMPWSKYSDAFYGNPANEFNEESLFELNVDPVEACWGVFCGDNPITESESTVYAPTIQGDDGSQVNGFTTGYGNVSFHDRNLARFGFNLPIQTLVKNPAHNNALSSSPSNPDSVLDPTYLSNSMALRTNKTCDPRLFVNGAQPWIDSANNGARVNSDGTPAATDYRKIVRYVNLNTSYYGWSFHKYAQFNYNLYKNQNSGSDNIYVFRLADMYLLYAEACINSGDPVTGLEYINKVHRRAYDKPVNTADPSTDYATLTSPTSAAAAGDPVLGNNPLYYERWAELMNEANWWFDVCRWKLGASEAAWYQKTFAAGAIQFTQRSYVWPIPQEEIDANPKCLQNPSY